MFSIDSNPRYLGPRSQRVKVCERLLNLVEVKSLLVIKKEPIIQELNWDEFSYMWTFQKFVKLKIQNFDSFHPVTADVIGAQFHKHEIIINMIETADNQPLYRTLLVSIKYCIFHGSFIFANFTSQSTKISTPIMFLFIVTETSQKSWNKTLANFLI